MVITALGTLALQQDSAGLPCFSDQCPQGRSWLVPYAPEPEKILSFAEQQSRTEEKLGRLSLSLPRDETIMP